MSPFIHFYPDISELEINPEEVFDILQQQDRSPDNPVVSETAEVFKMLPEIIDIRGGYAVFDDIEIFRKEGKIQINNVILSPHKKITGYVKDAEKIAVFISTAGEGFTRLTELYNREGEYLKSYIVDVFGSLIAEKTIDYIQKNLEKEMLESGLHISNRYSPGYCNWEVNDQRQLFDVLPDNECNILLTDSCLMLPIKSVSGIIGIGANVTKKRYACDICENKTCVYRKTKKSSQSSQEVKVDK